MKLLIEIPDGTRFKERLKESNGRGWLHVGDGHNFEAIGLVLLEINGKPWPTQPVPLTCGAHLGSIGPCNLPHGHVGDHVHVAIKPAEPSEKEKLRERTEHIYRMARTHGSTYATQLAAIVLEIVNALPDPRAER